jgi:hypothetical protein
MYNCNKKYGLKPGLQISKLYAPVVTQIIGSSNAKTKNIITFKTSNFFLNQKNIFLKKLANLSNGPTGSRG